MLGTAGRTVIGIASKRERGILQYKYKDQCVQERQAAIGAEINSNLMFYLYTFTPHIYSSTEMMASLQHFYFNSNVIKLPVHQIL